MRLSILSTMAEAPWGGSEELWAGVAAAALRRGDSVQALLPRFKDEHPKRAALVARGLTLRQWSADDLQAWAVHHQKNPTSESEPAVASPYRSLFDPRPDLALISHGGLMDVVNGHTGLLADLWASGLPYVLIIQANTELYWPNPVQRHILRGYFQGARAVVFVSRQNLEIARRQIADGIANAVVWQQPVNLGSVRPKKWPGGSGLHLACVARLDVGSKGQDMLIEVLATAPWKARTWSLNLYGTGPSASLLAELAELGGIADRVRFHGQVADVAGIWQENHVLVLPSRLEGTPLSLMEALCCGRPAVVTDVGGSADWIIPGKTGFLAKAPRVDAIAEAMAALWLNRNHLAAMGQDAAAFMARSFHESPGADLLAHLQWLLEAAPQGARVDQPEPALSVVRVLAAQFESPDLRPVGVPVEWIDVRLGQTGESAGEPGHLILGEPLGNPAVASSQGLRRARGRHVLFLADPTLPAENLVESLVSAGRAGSARFEPAGPADAPVRWALLPRASAQALGVFPASAQDRYLDWVRRESQALVVGPAGAVRPFGAASTPPAVSVVVACYNYARYLEQCVDSLLAQDFPDFEIIIVNDGSTDTTPLVADWLAGLHPGKIRVLHQANSGQPAISRNNGIAAARGEFLLPVDADDWLSPRMLGECVARLRADPAVDIVHTDSFYCHESGRIQLYPSGPFGLEPLLQHNRLSYCSMYRRKVWTTVGGYRTNVRGYEDWDFWIAAAAAGCRGQRIEKPLFFYRAKASGVYSDAVARDRLLRANIALNNPRCYSTEVRAQAKAYLDGRGRIEEFAAAETSGQVAVWEADRLSAVATACVGQGEWSLGVKACRRILATAPANLRALAFLRECYGKLGLVREAEAVAHQVIALQTGDSSSGSAPVRENLGSTPLKPGIAAGAMMPAAPIVAATVATSAAPASANASPQVSVVIACPDEARYLAEAVDSVLHQTFAPWEIIIVSDGRPDDASPAARRLIQAHPDRSIRLVEKAAGGLADARNAGIRRARGRYILPLNADDRLHPQMLEKTVALLEREPTVGIAYTDWAIFGAHSAVRQAVDFDVARLCTAENLFAYAALFRREAWEAAGGYNRNMTQGFEDWDFWVACAKHGQVGRRIPEPLLLRRARRAGALDAVSAHRRAMFARIVLNHPEIYAAGDIAAAQALLASAPPPPAPAASDGREWAPTPAPEDIFAKPEADNLCRIVDHYRHTPSDPGAIAQVLTLRQGIADFLRGVAPGRLEALFLGTFGLVYRRLLHSGVQCAAASPTSADPRLAWAQAVKQCEADDPTHALPVRLAALLFLQSPEAVFPTAQGAVPAWFRDDFGSLRPAASRVLAVKTDPVASAETNALPV